jgi:hypothetical protein
VGVVTITNPGFVDGQLASRVGIHLVETAQLLSRTQRLDSKAYMQDSFPNSLMSQQGQGQIPGSHSALPAQHPSAWVPSLSRRQETILSLTAWHLSSVKVLHLRNPLVLGRQGWLISWPTGNHSLCIFFHECAHEYVCIHVHVCPSTHIHTALCPFLSGLSTLSNLCSLFNGCIGCQCKEVQSLVCTLSLYYSKEKDGSQMRNKWG